MKKRILKLMMILAIGFLCEFSAKAQVIRERPRHEGIEVRPARPSPRHVWRDGEWEWRGGAYVWRQDCGLYLNMEVSGGQATGEGLVVVKCGCQVIGDSFAIIKLKLIGQTW